VGFSNDADREVADRSTQQGLKQVVLKRFGFACSIDGSFGIGFGLKRFERVGRVGDSSRSRFKVKVQGQDGVKECSVFKKVSFSVWDSLWRLDSISRQGKSYVSALPVLFKLTHIVCRSSAAAPQKNKGHWFGTDWIGLVELLYVKLK